MFDQDTPVGIRHSLHGHSVKTANEQGWSTLLNGELLRAAETAGFDVLLTTDTSLRFQQNLAGIRIAVVVINKNRWRLVRQPLPDIAAAITAARPGSWTVVEIQGSYAGSAKQKFRG